MLSSYPVCATLPSVNLALSKDFYTNKLGLKVDAEFDGGVIFEAGMGTRIMLYMRGPSPALHTQATFMISGIESLVHGLTSKGVVFEHYDLPGIKTNEKGIATTGNQKAAWFRDPDDNILALAEKE